MNKAFRHVTSRCFLAGMTVVLPGCALSPDWMPPTDSPVAVVENHAVKPPLLPSHGPLGLQQCVDFAIENNFSVRQSLALARASHALVEAQKAEFDPQLFGSVRDSRPVNGSWGNGAYSAGVTKKFTAGTEVDFEGGQVATRTGDFRDDFLKGSTSNFAASVRQPLLKGAGQNANLAGIRLAELLNVQASATVTAELLETLRAVETTYYAATVSAVVERSQMESYSRAQKLSDDVKVRHKAGAASQIDELEADTALSEARERLVQAQKAARDRVGDLWLALGAPLGDELPDVKLTALADRMLPEDTPDGTTAFARAMQTAPSAILIVNEVQRKEVELLRARNRALPRLDAEVSVASATGSGGGDDWESVALLRFNVPWGLRAEKAQLAAAQADLQRSVAAQDQATQRLKQRIFELCRAIQAGRAQVNAAANTASMSRRKYEEQLRRLKDGLVSIRDLRESEEELQSSEVREQQARLGLFAGWSALTQLDGTIVQRHGLSL